MSKSPTFSEEEQNNFEFGLANTIEEYALIALRANDSSSDFYDSDNVDRDQREAERDVKRRAVIAAKIIGGVFYYYLKKGVELEDAELDEKLIPHSWKESKRIYNDEIQLDDAIKGYINDRDKK